MKRRQFGIALALACACSALTGCETFRHNVRAKSDDASDEDAGSHVGEVRSEAPKGFFKASRLPGALSDEAREIERNLGVQ